MSQPHPPPLSTRPPRTMPPPTAPPAAGADPPSILVLGGTGLMGREVLGALRRRGVVPRVLVRDPARLATPDGVEVHVGDLRDPASLRRAMRRRRRRLPHLAARGRRGRADPHVVAACEEEGARLVFAGVHVTGRNALLGWLVRRFYGLCCRATAASSRSAGWSRRRRPTRSSSAPSNFMQNDEVLIDVIRGGEFVHPCHPKGLNRVDLRDVGEVAAGILLDPSTPSGTYPVVGPRSLTGPECAQVWSEALGRPVRYAGDDDAALEAALAGTSPATATTTGSRRCASCAASRSTPPPRSRDHRAAPRPPAHRLHRVRPPRPRRAHGVGRGSAVERAPPPLCRGGCPSHHSHPVLAGAVRRATSPATARYSS